MLTSAPGWWTGTLAHWTSRSGSTTGTTAIQFASGLFFCRYRYCPAIVTAGDPVFDLGIFFLFFSFPVISSFLQFGLTCQ